MTNEKARFNAALEKLKNSDELFLFAVDVAPVLGCDPQTLRLTAKKDIRLLGFPACVVGKTLRIPRKPFLDFIGC